LLSTILSVLLLILKIIGIILLVILGLILLILLVPIRYNFEVSAPEGADLKENFSAGAGISWFLFLIRARLNCVGTRLNYEVKLLGFTILGNDPVFLQKKEEKARKKEAKKEAEKAAEKEASKVDEKEAGGSPEVPVPVPEETDGPLPEEQKPSLTDISDSDSPGSDLPATGDSDLEKEEADYSPARTPSFPEEEKGQSPGKKEKKKKKKKEEKDAEKKKKKDESSSQPKSSLRDKLESLKNKIDEGIKFLDEYQVIALVRIAWDALIRLLKHLLPRRIQGWIRYGFEDPSATGYVAAASSLFYPSYHRNFSLEADFREACFAGNCHGKGRIRLGYLLWILITLLLKKEVRKLIRFILK